AGGVGQTGDADVDFGGGAFGDDVAAGAAGDDAGAYGSPALQIGEGRDAEELVRELQDGAGAGFEVQAGVRGAALDPKDVGAYTFAGSLHLTIQAGGGLEDQHGRALLRFGFRQRAGGGAADFFVRVELHDDATGDRSVEVAEGLEGEEGDGDATLHVEDARPVSAVGGGSEGHVAEGPCGVDGVVVT